MTYLVNEKCIKCKYTDCVEVRPVDCFYEGENMLVINPDECIDCGVCEPECPVDAIISDTDDKDEKWLEVNQKFSEIWPNITLDAPPMTRIKVANTPRVGKIGEITFIVLGDSNLPRLRPEIRGNKTRDATDRKTPCTSTRTDSPSNTLARRGVAITPRSVVESVQITDIATSPPAIRVNKLDAWPPLTQDNSNRPTTVELGAEKNTNLDITNAIEGTIP